MKANSYQRALDLAIKSNLHDYIRKITKQI